MSCLGELAGTSFDGEVIVADGGSRDGTIEAARSRAARVVETEPGRAGQMNAGAAAAEGDILLFLHVDTVLPRGFPHLVEASAGPGGASGGAFAFALDGEGWFYRVIERTANFRSRRLGVVFGDQAIFAATDAFRSVGGFPDLPVMEDCAFVDALKKEGPFVLLPEKAITSARRWEQAGPLWNTAVNVVITWAYRLGIPPERLRSWHSSAMPKGG